MRAGVGAGIGEGAGDKRHLLPDGDKGLLVIQRQQAGRGEDVGVGLPLQGVENDGHTEFFTDNAPAQGQARGAGQRAGEGAGVKIAGRHPASLGLTAGHHGPGDIPRPRVIRADAAAVQAAVVHEQPLQAQILTVNHLQLHNDRLDQHLRPANIQASDHRLQRRHLVGVGGDNQRVGALIGLDGGIALRRPVVFSLGAVELADVLHHPGQHLGNFRSLRVFQVNDLDVAGLLQGRIHIGNQFAHARALQFIAGHQHAVGTLVGHQEHFHFAAGVPGFRGVDLLQHAHHVLRHGIAQGDQVRFLHRRLVHALDNVANTGDIGGDIGNDDGVAGRVGGHVRLLGHQRPQHGNQFGRRDVIQAQHLGDVFVVDTRPRGRAGNGHGRGARVLVLDNAQHATGAHGGVTVDIENGEKQVVQLAGIDRPGGDDLDFAFDGGIDHDRGLGGLGHKADQLLDIGLLQIDREILGPSRPGFLRLRAGQASEQQSQGQGQRRAGRGKPAPRAAGAPGKTRAAARREKTCREKPWREKTHHGAAPGPRSLRSISRVTVPPSRSRVNVARVASRIS